MKQEECDQMDVVLSSKKTMIEGLVDFELAQKESKDNTIDLIIEIYIEESSRARESYIKAIQYKDIS